METLWQDFRYAVRVLLKRPGFTAVAVLSLTLGIGANTTIFTFVKAVFLQGVPVKEPSRVMSPLFHAGKQRRHEYPVPAVVEPERSRLPRKE